jgi:hypoxanthine phosphoribosyltransferase
MKTIKYPYNEYKKDLNSLVKQIQKKNTKYDFVLGVERGGLIPAVHLSHRLGIPLKTLSWSSQLKDGSMLTWFILRNKKILLVDDIVDSGKTFLEIFGKYWNMDTAVLIYNNINESKIKPDYYGRMINRKDTPEWFDFWWEK